MTSESRSLMPVEAGPPMEVQPYAGGVGMWHGPGPEAQRRRSSLLDLVHRYRNGMFIILAVCVLGALLTALLTPKTYRSQAQVEFQDPPGQSAGAGNPAQAAAVAARSREVEETQVGLVRSRALAEKVGETLGGTKSARLAPALGLDAGSATKEELAGALQRGVGVDLPGNSRLATIRFDSRDPVVSAAAANAYVDSFIETSLQRQYDASTGSRDFLQARLADAKAKLANSEKALIAYTRQAKLVDSSAGTSSVTGGSAPVSLSSEKLMQMTQAQSTVRSDRIAAEQRWREAQGTPADSLPEVLANPAIQALKTKSAEAQALYEQERQRRTDQHPAVQQAAAHIAEINRQIAALSSSVRDSIRERYEVAARQEAQITGSVNQLENQTLADQGKGVRYNLLKREADGNRQLYQTLLQRMNEVEMAAGLPAHIVTPVDRAEPVSEPIAPKPFESAALGGAAGVALSFLYLFGVFLLDESVHSPEQLNAKLRVPLLGVLPHARHPLEALEDPGSPLSEAQYSLRTTLELAHSREALGTTLFTSSRESEGKTVSAYGLARNFAQSGRRVLLIDADMRKPSVHKLVGLDPQVGLSSVLAGQCEPDDAVVDTSVPLLSILPAGPIPESAAALLSGKQFGNMLRHLSRAYDMVIIDAPPVFGLADSPRLAAVASSTIFVVEADRAKVPVVSAALKRLMEARANVIGAVLTKFDVRRAGSDANLYVYEYGRGEDRRRLTAA